MGLLRAVATAALFVGPLSWLRRSSKLAPGWHPLLVLCAWALTVFIAGLSGHLVTGVVAIVATSVGILLRELILDRVNVVATLREPALLVFAVSVLLLTVLVHGQLFTHYDNFSHWALVVSVMLDDNDFPTPADDVVGFTTYPLGGAGLPYLANLLLGRAEWVSMLAHSTFIVSCALPLISATGRRWVAGLLLYGVAAVALLTHVTSPASLLVDALVAGLGGALLALVLLHRTQILLQPWPLAVVGATLVTIKSSGVFFVAIVLVLSVLLLRRSWAGSDRRWLSGDAGAALAAWATTLAAPWVLWWLWGRHVQTTFPAADESKHSVSLSRFDAVLGAKTGADLRSILGDFLGKVLLDGWLWLLLAALLLAGALAVRSGSIEARGHRRVLFVMLTTALLWEVSLALMYLLSMPLGEALKLAGFRRYQGTIHLVLMVVLLALVATWWSSTPRLVPGQLAVAALVMVIPLTVTSPRGLVNLPDQHQRVALQSALAGVVVTPQDPVCLLQEGTDGGYRTWMTRFILNHQDVRPIVVKPDATRLPKRLGACEVTILLDPRPHTLDLARQAGVRVGAQTELPMVITP